MKSTITDVARRAGVSIKTVSRVLNNEPNVTDKTRDKVQDAVKALEYRPNFSARSLAGNRSYLLAMVYDNPSVEYITHMQKGATEACRQHGYHLVVEPVDWDNGDLTNDIEMLLGRLPVDGVILTPPVCDSRRIVSALEKARIPMVRICPRNPNMTSAPSLNMDDAAAAYDMTGYLIKCGHTDIGFIRGASSHESAHLREQGFRKALKDADLELDPARIVDGNYTFEAGLAGAQTLLSGYTRPSAIFAGNDDMAAGTIAGAGALGLNVPDDLSVCGFDNTALASMIYPPLTTVSQPISDAGARAARVLIDRAGGTGDDREPQDIAVDYEIVIRGSTKTLGD